MLHINVVRPSIKATNHFKPKGALPLCTGSEVVGVHMKVGSSLFILMQLNSCKFESVHVTY